MQLYSLEHHRSHTSIYNYDPTVALGFSASLTLWMLGFPEQALQKSQDAIKAAHELSHPLSLTLALAANIVIHGLRGEFIAVQQSANETISLARQRGFRNWEIGALFMQGWASIQQSNLSDKEIIEWLAQMHQALEKWLDPGTAGFQTHFHFLIAQVLGKIGQFEKALHYLDEALERVELTGERWWEAELQRLKGDMFLLQRDSDAESAAEQCFERALRIANDQHARSLQLRAIMGLSKLWHQQGKGARALAALAHTYNGFSEGFGTTDLATAKALLDQLSG